MAEKTRAVLKAELKTSEKKKEELQEKADELQRAVDNQRVSLKQMQHDIGHKDEKIRDLQDRLDGSLDKETAEFFMSKIIVIVEKMVDELDC